MEQNLPHLKEKEREREAERILNEIRSDPVYIEDWRKQFIEDNYRKFGICSLAGSKNNLLMWAHYAAEHTGFCVGLSTLKLNGLMNIIAKKNKDHIELINVKYSDTIPHFDFFEATLNPDDTSIDAFIATKSHQWAYEEEYRLVFWNHSNVPVAVGYEAITEVILGCKISGSDKKQIIDLCSAHVPHARLLQAVKDQRHFALNFEEIK